MSLGVPEGKLIMVDYDPAWKTIGEETVKLLKGVMKNAVDIQHIGSSSVVGMFGKPLIDIGVGVHEPDDVLEYVDELEGMGIHYAGEVIEGQREFYINDPETGYKAYHIHCLKYGSAKWKRYILIRDYLNANETARESYILLKKALLLIYSDRPDHYGPAKNYYMDDMELDAIAWSDSVEK